MGEGRRMTKGELIKILDGLDDNAQIYVSTSDNDDYCYNITDYCDKVTDDGVENEITLLAK